MKEILQDAFTSSRSSRKEGLTMTVKKWKGTTKNGMKSQKRNTLDRNVTTMAEQWSFIFFMHVAGTRVAISKALA